MIIFKRISTLIPFVSFLFCGAALALPEGLNSPLHQSILVNKYSGSPKAQWLMHATVRMANRGIDPDLIRTKIMEVSNEYDRQVALHKTGRLTDEGGNREALYSIMKNAYTTVIGASGPVLAVFADVVFDKAIDSVETSIAAESVDRAGEFLADQQTESILRIGTHVEYITDSYEKLDPHYKQLLSERFVEDVQFDIEAADEVLVAQNPGVGALLQSEANGRSLMAIYNEIKDLPSNADLTRYRDEIINAVGGQINGLEGRLSDSLAGIKSGQQEISDEIRYATNNLGMQLGRNQKLLTYVAKSIQQQEAARAKAALDAAKRAELKAYMHLGSLLLNQINPELSRNLNVTINAAVKIDAAFDRLESLESLGDIGTAVAIADIANAAMSIQGLFAATQPSTDQIMFDMIAQIQMQIQELRIEMNERFDAVDQKLDEILGAIDRGFSVVTDKLDTNLNAVLVNTAIGLDTQSLIMSETERLSNLLKDLSIIPCMDVRHSDTVEMPDLEFLECASKLRRYSTNSIKGEQIPYDDTWSFLTFAERLEFDQGSRMADALYQEYLLRLALPRDAGTIVDPSQWQLVSKWYTEFLLEDLAQTQRVFSSEGLETIIQNGEDIKIFRNLILDSFRDFPDNRFTSFYTPIPAARPDFFANSLLIAWGNAFSDARDSYNAKIPFQFRIFAAVSEFSDFPYSVRDLQILENGVHSTRGHIVYDNQAGNSRLASDLIATSLDPNLIRAIAAGLGHITYRSRWLSDTTRTGCRQYVFGVCVDRRTEITTTTYRTSVLYKSNTGDNKEFEIGNFTSTWDHNDIGIGIDSQVKEDRYGRIGFTNWWAGQIMARTKTMNLVNVAGQIGPLVEEYNFHRTNIASDAITLLSDGSNLELENEIAFENAFLAALVRFAFSDVIGQSDTLYALATGNAGIPTIEDGLRAIGSDVTLFYQLNHFYNAEAAAIREYFLSDQFLDLVDAASVHTSVNETISALKDTKISVELASANNGEQDPVTTTEEGSSSSGGGGAVESFFLLGLALVYLLSGLRPRFFGFLNPALSY